MAEQSHDPVIKALEELSTLTEAQHSRVRRALKEEEKAGGPLNRDVSTEVRRTHRMRVDEITLMSKIGSNRTPVTTAKSGGIVSQMLASLLPKRKDPKRRVTRTTARESAETESRRDAV